MMNRKVISAAVAVAMTATMSSFALPANSAISNKRTSNGKA